MLFRNRNAQLMDLVYNLLCESQNAQHPRTSTQFYLQSDEMLELNVILCAWHQNFPSSKYVPLERASLLAHQELTR